MAAQAPTKTSTAKSTADAGQPISAGLYNVYKQTVAPPLTQSIVEELPKILSSIGLKSLNENERQAVIREIAPEVVRQIMEDLPKIQSAAQRIQVIANSLAESIEAHQTLETKLKLSLGEIYQKVEDSAQRIAGAHQQDLEKITVLGKISLLSRPDQASLDLIAEQVERSCEIEAPLTPPQDVAVVKGAVVAYTGTYKQKLQEKLKSTSTNNIPTLAKFHEMQTAIHEESIAPLEKTLVAKLGQKTVDRLKPAQVTAEITQILGFKPLSEEQAEKLGLGRAQPTLFSFTKKAGIGGFLFGLIFATDEKTQEKIYYALLGHDRQILDRFFKPLSAKVQAFKKQGPLTLRERKDFKRAQRELAPFQEAVKIASSPQAGQYLSQLQNHPELTPIVASHIAYNVTNALLNKLPGVFTPTSITTGPRFLAGRAIGGLAANVGRFNLGFAKPVLSLVKIAPRVFGPVGMAVSAALGAVPLIKRIAKIGATMLGGLGLYFLGLAKAALIGFAIGAGIGGIAGAISGAIVGAQIGAAIGTAIAPGIGTVIGGAIGGAIGGTIGFIGGATIGGIIGGIIGYGLASGSVTITATGVGAAIGLGIGGIPGMVLGAAAGYLVGKYAIPALKSAYETVASGASTGASAGAGVVSTITGYISGAISSAIGALSGALNAAVGAVSSAASFLVSPFGIGHAAAATTTAGALAPPALTAVATPVIAGVTVITITATSLFSLEVDTSQLVPGENEFFTIAKVASTQHLKNSPPNQDLTFTITFTAKDKNLSNITITDELKVQNSTSSFTVTQDNTGRPISPIPCPSSILANNSCTYSFTITVDSSFNNSVISNTATAKATPEGSSEIANSVSVSVSVGSPPAQCPRGWPAIGDVTQGPEGLTSHGPGGYEAIDIGQGLFGGVGRPVYATVEGTVTSSFINNSDTLDQRIGIQPTACAGLYVVYYWHLSARNVNVGDIIKYGQVIGATGQAGTGPHIHYQFNNSGDRSFPMASPHIPTSVPRPCDSPQECNVKITSAP